MTRPTASLDALQQKLDYLMDRSEVLDCVARYARGVDRHDAELMVSAYHADGLDVHGHAVNDMAHFAAWANALHDTNFQRHTHCLTTHNCEIAGDTAHSESYVLFGLLTHDGNAVWLGCGRYVDRLEKREGAWKIALRRTTVEWMVTADTAPMKTKYFREQGYAAGVTNRTDLAYERPLQLPASTGKA
ncbi:MAG: nuclear transport factor 2 family protein [Gammaproteobacteria bacterium]